MRNLAYSPNDFLHYLAFYTHFTRHLLFSFPCISYTYYPIFYYYYRVYE